MDSSEQMVTLVPNTVASRLGALTLDEPLSTLPEDVIISILVFAPCRDLARAALCCRSWNALVKAAAHRLLPGATLRHIAAREQLRLKIGAQPNHAWTAEWGPLLAEEFRLRGYPGPTPQDAALGDHSIESMLRALCLPISWLQEAGWTLQQAEPATLLGFCGRAALGRALRDNCNAYSACSHLLHEVLSARARALETTAPPAYRNLSGNGGLVTDDPAWAGLLRIDLDALETDAAGFVLSAPAIADGAADIVSDGVDGAGSIAAARAGTDGTAASADPLRFVTSALVLADTSPLNFASEAGYSVLTWAPAVAGGGATMEYVLQESDVVCFRSEPTDGRGYHSLLHTGGSGFTMPPMASVVIERVQRPGEWVMGGHAIQRTLFTARFTYL